MSAPEFVCVLAGGVGIERKVILGFADYCACAIVLRLAANPPPLRCALNEQIVHSSPILEK